MIKIFVFLWRLSKEDGDDRELQYQNQRRCYIISNRRIGISDYEVREEFIDDRWKRNKFWTTGFFTRRWREYKGACMLMRLLPTTIFSLGAWHNRHCELSGLSVFRGALYSCELITMIRLYVWILKINSRI